MIGTKERGKVVRPLLGRFRVYPYRPLLSVKQRWCLAALALCLGALIVSRFL